MAKNSPTIEQILDYGISTKFDAYSGKEPYLFVSYSHHDCDKVYPILDMLHDKKYRIWYDESCENGNDFRKELRERIENSSGILLFVSKHSLASPYCGMEIIVAREYGKQLHPIYLDDAEVPPAFEILLANIHHGTITNMDKLMKSMVRDLPAVTMDRLTKDKDVLTKCEDNGDSIEVDEGIKTIAKKAFKGRQMLHHIKLPETLEIIEKESFRGCSNLENIVIPKSVSKIGESAFRDCISMVTLTILNDKVKIGERAFENCADLEEIILPDGLTEIYGGVFNSCKHLTHIDLPPRLTILGDSAFSDCIKLESIVIPPSVTKIDDLVFNGCVELKSIKLHEGLKKIGKASFKNCRALTSIDIPVTVSNISDAPFRGCESLKSIKVDKGNRYYKSQPNKREGKDHVLFDKCKSRIIAYPANSREVQYDIPDSVTIISDWAFCECKKLNRVTIPDSVREIGEGAFSYCELLDEVHIPDSVEKIDDCAFRGCTHLEKVIIPDSVKDLGWGVFDGCEEIVTVYCNENSPAAEYCARNDIRFKNPNDFEDEGLS